MARTDDPTPYLEPDALVDSDHPKVVAFAERAVGDAATDAEKAARLFAAVRDGLRYDPWTVTADREDYRASRIVERERAFCVPKAILLAAAARAVGIPARVGFADVKNHLSSERLQETMGTDLFVFHGYTELFVNGRWLKATPAFNRALCERFGVAPLELDGEHDALLQPFDGEGRAYMEYVRDRGTYDEVPVDEMLAAWREAYGAGELIPGGESDDPAFAE